MFVSAVLCLSAIGFVLVVANSQADLAKANNAFALDIYKKIGNESKNGNMFLSPISISTAFGMVNLGAKGNTQAQLKAVLHLGPVGSDETIREAYKQMLTAFKRHGNNYTLHLVNRLFGSNKFQFQDQYKLDTHNYFQATLEALDFENGPEESRVHINNWVAKETNEKIKDLLPPSTINAFTVLVIVNAIYFNGVWEHPFSRNLTKPGPFHASKTEQFQIDMMNLPQTDFNYYDSTELECRVLELPYIQDKAKMVIFLPNDIEGLSKLEERLTAQKLNDTLSKTQSAEVNLKFPKFKMEMSISLKKFLESMGMTDLFCPGHSDLSGIGGPQRLTVTEAIHKSFVNVDEIGTEAAAATAIIFTRTSWQNKSPVDFVVDRPFLFLILEKDTNTILFLGRLFRPPAGGESIGKFGETAAQKGDGVRLYASRLFVVWSIVFLCFAYCFFP